MRYLVFTIMLISFNSFALTTDPVESFCTSYLETKLTMQAEKSYPLEPACKRYVKTRQCQNKKVCKMVCGAAGGAIGGAGGAIGGAACSEVCEYIPECLDYYKCVEYH